MPSRKSPTPFDELPGFWNRVNRFVFRFAGPAQVGAGRVEEPYVAPSDPQCPVCGKALARHELRRGTASTPTRLSCPVG